MVPTFPDDKRGDGASVGDDSVADSCALFPLLRSAGFELGWDLPRDFEGCSKAIFFKFLLLLADVGFFTPEEDCGPLGVLLEIL